jgi:hypothetical protein
MIREKAHHTRPSIASTPPGGGVEVWTTEEEAEVRPCEREKGVKSRKEMLEASQGMLSTIVGEDEEASVRTYTSVKSIFRA